MFSDTTEGVFYNQAYADPNVSPEYVEEGVSSKRASLQLLGMAIHVAGGAYAHREIIPAKVAEEKGEYKKEHKKLNKKNLFENCKKLLKKIKKGNITTSGLRNYAKNDDKIKEHIKDIHRITADNINFLRKRYSQGTNFSIKKILNQYNDSNRKNLAYVFCPLLSYKSYNLRLDRLIENIEDSGYTLEELSLVSESKWKKLSRKGERIR